MRAASMPSKRPSSIIHCLPLPRSSAGVPKKTISPGSSAAMDARAIRARAPPRSAFDGQGRLCDCNEREDEQGDRRLERAEEAEDDEDGNHDEHPCPSSDGPQPVATIRDPAMSPEDSQPEDRNGRQ